MNSFSVRRVLGGYLLQTRPVRAGDQVQHLERNSDGLGWTWQPAVMDRDAYGMFAKDTQTGDRIERDALRWPPPQDQQPQEHQMTTTILEIENRHIAASGPGPDILHAAKGTNYCSYFENCHGEQWIFTYDFMEEVGCLRGGDVGWGAEHTVRFEGATSPDAPPLTVDYDGLILSNDERAWLGACGLAIQAHRTNRADTRAERSR